MTYLEALARSGHNPNFWCSREYFAKAGWREVQEGDYVRMVDDEGVMMLPEIYQGACVDTVANGKYWAGFSTMKQDPGTVLLDHEFIYRPEDFLSLHGQNNRLLRKNINEALADVGESVSLVPLDTVDVDRFLSDWFSAKESETFYDPDVMVEYLAEGEHRMALWGESSWKVYGVLAFDFNFKYVNFRYCAVEPGIRGLSDLARVRFYWYIRSKYGERLVNDGGSLGRPGLYKYKLRLHPVAVGQIYGREAI